MRREHERAIGVEQKPVDLGDRKPLEVQDVRGTGEHAPGREGVLECLQRQPDGVPGGFG